METTTGKVKNSKIAGLLQKVEQELDEMQVQLSLGKMEAKDKYQELRQEFNQYIIAFRRELNEAKDVTKEQYGVIVNKIDELETELKDSNKDEDKEKLLTRMQRIRQVSDELKILVKDRNGFSEAAAVISYQLQKMSIKMAMLRLYYQAGKLELKHTWETQKNDFDVSVKKLERTIEQKKETAIKWWTHFKDEIEESFEHLERAVFNKK